MLHKVFLTNTYSNISRQSFPASMWLLLCHIMALMAAVPAPCAQTRVVWIATAPDTRFKLREKVKDTGKVFQKRLCNINQAANTLEILQECENNRLQVVEMLADQIVGVALVEPAFIFDALQELRKEEKLQRDLFQTLHSPDVSLHGMLASFHIKELLVLPEVMPVQRVGSRSSTNFFSSMQEGQLDRLMALLEEANIDVPPWLHRGMQLGQGEFLVHLPKLQACGIPLCPWCLVTVLCMRYAKLHLQRLGYGGLPCNLDTNGVSTSAIPKASN